MKTPLIIAVVGKGGTGKTVITALLAKAISQNYDYKLLLIDADPTHPHLSKMVNLIPKKSLESIRADVIEQTLENEKNITIIAENIDFKVYDALTESKQFSLFSIGQPEGPGCFCPSNALLRKVIESISKDFDVVLIDCEAGLEQINRMVIEKVDTLLIVSDISLRSIETADSIRKNASKYTGFKKLGLILNRVKGDVTNLLRKLGELNLPLIAEVPEDNLIMNLDLEGKPIINLPEESISFKSVSKLTEQLFRN